MAILAALLGSWGRRGGYLTPAKFPLPAYPLPSDLPHRPVPATVDKPKGGRRIPLATEVLASGLCDAAKPGHALYDLKAWIVYGCNLVQAMPGRQELIETMQNLEFLVAVDVLPAEIAGWADVVLPGGDLPRARGRRLRARLQAAVRRDPAGRGRAAGRLEAGLVDREGARDPRRPRGVVPVEGREGVREDAPRAEGALLRRARREGRPPRRGPADLRGGGGAGRRRHREREDRALLEGAAGARLRPAARSTGRRTRGRRARSGCSPAAPRSTPSAAP